MVHIIWSILYGDLDMVSITRSMLYGLLIFYAKFAPMKRSRLTSDLSE